MSRPDKSSQDQQYAICDQLLADGQVAQAERRLWQMLKHSPRAAQSVMLLGISLLLQGKFARAEAVIDKAYRLKPWIRDDFSHYEGICDAATAASKERPDWLWPSYLLRKDRYHWVGLDVATAIEFLASRDKRKFFFVQVGANDGRRGDPIAKAVRKLGLEGVLVEPIPEVFEKLEQNYASSKGLTFVNAAITVEDGPVELFIDKSVATTLASLVPTRNALRGSRQKLESVRVQGMQFSSLVAKYKIKSMQLLQIDTEGYDYHVLKQAPLADLGTKIVNMEFYCLPIEERLQTFDILDAAEMAYQFNGMDLLAVDRELYGREFCIFEARE